MSILMEELAAPTLSTLAPTRRQILESLKKRGELTTDDLADQLELTTSGVRQHLVALTSDGLVARRYGQACSSEIGFLRESLPEARIERVQHMIAGAHSCAYEVKPE